MFCKVLEQVIEFVWSHHHQKTPFFAPKMVKNAIFSPKQCFWGLSGQLWGPPPYFEGAGFEGKVLCKVLEQVIECFGAAITKKNRIFAQKWPKNAVL